MKEALRSLKNDFVSAFFYWLTFVITSLFIFLFFTISMSEGIGVTVVYARNDIATNLMIFSVILCSVDIVFANDFFIKKKAKELAVRLICGATYMQLAGFLLIQTLILLLTAIPLGITFGIALIPLSNYIFQTSLHAAIYVSITFQAVLWTALVIGYVVFWTLILNLSFAYRNSATMLLNENGIKIPKVGFFPAKSKKVTKVLQILDWCLFLLPIVLFYVQKDTAVILAIASLIGFNNVIHRTVLPALENHIQTHIGESSLVAYLGFVRYDLKILRSNLILFLTSAIILVSILVTAKSPTDIMLVLITYIAMSILLSMAIMFKFSSDIPTRIRYYKTLSHIGFMDVNIKTVIKKEVLLFYGFVVCTICIYLLNMFGVLFLEGQIDFHEVILLTLASVLPVVVSGLINFIYYQKTMISK